MRSKSYFYLQIITAALFLLNPLSSYCEEIWKMTSLSWGPYVDENAPYKGSLSKVLSDLLEKEGIKLVVEFYPWERAKRKAESNDYVGYFPAWPEEVAKGFKASPVIGWSEIAVFKRKGTEVKYDSLKELFTNYKVGIVGSYIYPEEISRYIKNYHFNIDKAPDEVSLVRKLVNGRHPVIITDPEVMKYYAGILNIRSIEAAGIIMRKELVVAMRDDEENRKRIELLEKILSFSEKK